MEEAHISKFIVREYEVDAGGGVAHGTYLDYYQQARHHFLLSLEFPFDAMRHEGIGFVVLRVETDYYRSLYMDQEFIITTEMTRISRLKFRFDQKIQTADKNLISTGINIGTILGRDGKPCIPTMIEEKISAYPIKKHENKK